MADILLPSFIIVLFLASIVVLIANIVRTASHNYSSLSGILAISLGIIDCILNFITFASLMFLEFLFASCNGVDGLDNSTEMEFFAIGMIVTALFTGVSVVLIILGVKQKRAIANGE